MTDSSLDRIYQHFEARTEAACAAGKGLELLHELLGALAEHIAKMEAEVARVASDERAAEVVDWALAFPEQQGVKLLEGLERTLRDFGATPEMIAARSYCGARRRVGPARAATRDAGRAASDRCGRG